MKRIEMSNGIIYATNSAGEGVFRRRVHDGAYIQLRGTCQTPTFRTPEQFRRWLRRHMDVRGVRMIAAYGWDEE